MFKFVDATVWSWNQSHAHDKGNENGAMTLRTEHACLLYTEERAYVDFERKRQLLTSKLLLYVQPASVITITPADSKAATVTCIAFQAYTLDQQTAERLVYQLNYSSLPYNGYVTKPVAQRTARLIHELAQQSRQAMPDAYVCDRHLNELVQQMLEQLNRVTRLKATAKQVVTETIQSMLEHYEQDWTREETARSRQFNVSHFSRAFKTVSSYSFSELLGKIRLNQAKILLLATTMTLDQIAHRTGFISGLYLSRRLKQDCGLSPRSYRSLLKSKPLRIATMHQAGDWLALGIVPVAASFAPWHTSPLLHESLQRLGTVNIYELEDIACLRQQQPDLIVIPDYVLIQNTSRLRQLEQIAPVLFLPAWRESNLSRLMLLAQMMGKVSEAKQWQAQFQLVASKWQQRLRQIIAPHETAACYEVRGEEQIIVWLSGGRSSSNFYEALELRLPPLLAQSRQDKQNTLTLTRGQLPQFAADHMFIIHQNADNLEQFYAMLESDEAWSGLPALKSRRMYPLSLQPFWIDDAATLDLQLPLIVESAEAVQRWSESGK